MSEINHSEYYQESLTFRERFRKFFGKPGVDYAPDYHELSGNLKIDISTLDPVQESALQDKALSANKHLLEVLGMFIPASIVERNKEIEKKVIVTSKKNFDEYASSILDLPISDLTPPKLYALAQPSAIVMIQPSDTYAWTLMDNKNQAELYKKKDFKDEIWAKEEVNQRYFNRNLFHELIHMYQSQYPPDKSRLVSFYFREAGAFYYARKLYPDGAISSKDDIVLSNLYTQLSDKYGDNLHRLFFGQPILESDRKQIMHDFKNSKLVY